MITVDFEHLIGEILCEKTPLDEVIERAWGLTKTNFVPKCLAAADVDAGGIAYWCMQLYAPIYVSSYCVNKCLYCGFRSPCAIKRRHLSVAETVVESECLLHRGFKSQLIVAGESPKVSPKYLAEIIRELRARDIFPSIEVAPMSVDAYAEVVTAGCHGITLFQETFDKTLYRQYHSSGPKSDYDWRYHAIERAAEAGMARLGFGVLVGLAEPKRELVALAKLAATLQAKYPNRTLAFSLPRIHTGPNGFDVPFRVPDELFIRMYCALRLLFPHAELVLSTRETAELRNRLASICITQMSAESSTEPGGYVLSDVGADSQPTSQNESAFNGQFPVTDHRSTSEITRWLLQNGHAIRW